MDYPSNANKQSARAAPTEPREAKKVKQVTQGKVIRRKKPLGKRFRETFISGDARSSLGFVFMDTFVPSIKDMLLDGLNQLAERMLLGDSRPSSRRNYSNSPYGRIAYNQVRSSSIFRPDPRNESRTLSRRARTSHDFGEIVLETRPEANKVLDDMFEMISRYDQVTLADLCDLVGIEGEYTDDKWGWTDLQGATVSRVRDGYILNLPRVIPLT